jgi:hypothetical protein
MRLSDDSLWRWQVTPILTVLDVPVRAIVAPFLDQHASRLLSEAVRRTVLPLEPAGGVWLQNSAMYHATVWHASHHQASSLSGRPDRANAA